MEQITAQNEAISLGEPDSEQITAPKDAISLGEPDSEQIAARSVLNEQMCLRGLL
jgi:hypothetical protein